MGTPLEMEIALPHAISHEGMALNLHHFLFHPVVDTDEEFPPRMA